MDVQVPNRLMELFVKPSCSPIICPFYHYFFCGWTGSFEDIMEHCTTKHGAYTSKGYKQDYTIEKFLTIKIRKDFPNVIQAHGNVFMVWLQKFPSGFLRIRLHSMGCCNDPSRYKGFISFQSYKELPLICYSEDEYREGLDILDDTKVYINTSHFLRPTEDLNYTIQIKDTAFETYLSRIS